MGDDIGWFQPSIYPQGLAVGETPNIDRIAMKAQSSTHITPSRASGGGG
jgi:arylsulfatase A-like enzyme